MFYELRWREILFFASAFEKLPEDYREVIFLRNLEGVSHEEIAKHLNRSLGAVRMLWVRALSQLKKYLAVLE